MQSTLTRGGLARLRAAGQRSLVIPRSRGVAHLKLLKKWVVTG